MKRTVLITSCMLALILAGFGCKTKVKQNNDSMTYDKGSFGYDASFMQQHQNSIVLKKGDARVLLVPAYQGRVMTSSAAGESGMSFGWLNYSLIETGKPVAHFNNYGGEERLWLGPEGGQFSIFFPPGAAFEFDHWQVPAPIDTEPFDLVSANDTMAIFARDTEFTNYSGYRFLTRIQRTVWLLDKSNVYQQYGILIPEELQMVAYQSENQITNTGKMPWSHETGLLSVWVLGQLISSPSNIVLAPYADGPQSELGPVVNDNYFGKVPPERLKILDKLILFKADGLQRGKIGLSPLRAKDFLGSVDLDQNVLTIVKYNKPDQHEGYVNSMWELQEHPFSGDAVNSYNDGPLDDGSQLGPFYELETSSPAAVLGPGESLTHISTTMHLTGSSEAIDAVLMSLFGITKQEIRDAFSQ